MRNTPMVRFETSHGGFTVELYDEDAPQTVENFLRYVDDGFFDGTIFHRIVPGFVTNAERCRWRAPMRSTVPPRNSSSISPITIFSTSARVSTVMRCSAAS